MEKIKRECPSARVLLLIKKQYSSLFQDHPFLDEIIGFDGFNAGLWNRLYALNISAILDLHRNSRSFWIKCKFWNVPAVSLDKRGFRRWLLVKKWSKQAVESVVLRYLKATKELLGVLNIRHTKMDAGANLDGLITPGLSLPDFRHTLEPLKQQDWWTLEKKRYGVLHISATYNTKRIPAAVWRTIMELQAEDLVITGGPEDARNAQALVDMSENHPGKHGFRTMNAVGKTNLQQTAALVQGAQWFVGGDTGFTHVAAAYGVPHVMVWGNTAPDLGFSTWLGDKFNAEIRQDLRVAGLKCQPCSKLGHDACPEGHFACMKMQNMQELESKLQFLRDRKK